VHDMGDSAGNTAGDFRDLLRQSLDGSAAAPGLPRGLLGPAWRECDQRFAAIRTTPFLIRRRLCAALIPGSTVSASEWDPAATFAY